MGILGTSNGTVMNAVQQQGEQQFKSMNNLLSLQDNHVEEFFQYHGEQFLIALEKLMEDVVQRVVSQMLSLSVSILICPTTSIASLVGLLLSPNVGGFIK